MLIQAIGIVLLVVLIVITWRIIDAIMQAPGTSAALPLPSVPQVASDVLGSNTQLPSSSDVYSGISGLSMPTTNMSNFFPTSLAGTPTPNVPNAADASTPPTTSTPASVDTLSGPANVSDSTSSQPAFPSVASSILSAQSATPNATSNTTYGDPVVPSVISELSVLKSDPAIIGSAPKAYTGAFDRTAYLAANGDIAAIAPSEAPGWPYTHWLTAGMREGRAGSGQTLIDAPPPPGYSGKFNEQTYLSENDDVLNVIKNGLFKGSGYDHWTKWGMIEGRNGSGFTRVT